MEPRTRKTNCNPLLMNFNEPCHKENEEGEYNFYYDPVHQIAYYMGGGGSSSGSSRGGRNTETKKGGRWTHKKISPNYSQDVEDDARYYMDD